MFRSFVATLYPRIPAIYRSDYSADEAVQRLRAVIEPPLFHSPFRECAVGRVRRNHVWLHRVVPYFANSLKPVFVGAFNESAEGVVLQGSFSTFMFVKIFMTIWFGIPFIGTVAATVVTIFGIASGKIPSTLPNFSAIIVAPLFGAFFISLGYFFLSVGWWLSRGDMDYLSNTISRALTRSP